MKFKITRLLLWLSLISMFLFISGCNNSNDNDQTITQTSASNSNTNKVLNTAKPPKIDMHSAVISEDIEAIKQHILAGSDINQRDPFGGSSPLISAALFGKQNIVSLLVDAGAELNFQNNDGSTALHTAAFFCKPEIVQFLLDSGIDKTIKNYSGHTAYDTVAGPFEAVKPIYDVIGHSLAPMGLILDYEHLKTTRPKVADMLK